MSSWSGLVPKSDTQADLYLENYPNYDGRGVIVAILDTGVDPGAIGLQRTSDGKPKVIDLVDATGAGDVDTSKVVTTTKPACLQGLSGRELHLGAWDNPSGKYHLGVKRGYEIFPKQLVKRLKSERASTWNKKQRAATNALELRIATLSRDASTNKDAISDTKVQLDQLRETTASTSPDEGPLYDLVVFCDGSGTWRCAIDVSQTGDLRGATLYTNYRAERQYGTFEPQDGLMNFAINIYDDGNVVSIYADTGAHGTHVAGIVSGYNPEQSDLNGVAPGAQIVGIKIGDTRLGSMETGPGLERGLLAVLENGCDVINMSYGEPTKTSNQGRYAEFARMVVEEHGVVFVASAGNAGPALSTAGAPGGTTTSLIGVGAYVSPHMMRDEYAMRQQQDSSSETKDTTTSMDTYPPGMQYTWSSRGPAFDGDFGPNVTAPGGAIACVPNWTLQRNQLMNGTSMSSPNCAGNVALILSGLKSIGAAYTPHLIKRALENTARAIPNHTVHDVGHGMIQTLNAFEWIRNFGSPSNGSSAWTTPTHMQYDCYRRTSGGVCRGVYLRDAADLQSPLVTKMGVKPCFRELGNPIGGHTNRDRVEFQLRATLTTTANWVQAPDQCLLAATGKEFDIRIDPTNLTPGLHYAEVQGRAQGTDVTSGPLFRFPITICIPETKKKTNQDYVYDLVLSPGQVTRHFLTVPESATWVDIAVTGGGSYGGGDSGANPRLYALHLQQVCEHEAHRDITFKKFFYLANPTQEYGNGRKVFSHCLTPLGSASGQTMELCFAQYWSSLGDSSVTVRANFRSGVFPSNTSPTIVAGEGVCKIDVRNPINGGTVQIKPSAKLTKWTRVLMPTSFKVSPPNVQSRDVWPDGKMTQCLEVTYMFDQPKSGKVTPSCPILANLLYDSPVGAQMCIVRNERGLFLGVSDAFPEEVNVPKGNRNTITLHIAHHDLSLLKKFENTPLHLSRKLDKAVSPTFHKSRASAATKNGTFGSRKLLMGKHCTVFMACSEESLDKSHQPGDFLSGTMSYCNGAEHQKWSDYGEGKVPGGYMCRVVVGGGKAKAIAKPTVDLVAATGSVDGGVMPGELKSRAALMHEWSIKRLRKEFEGKKAAKEGEKDATAVDGDDVAAAVAVPSYEEEYSVVVNSLNNDRETLLSKNEYEVLSTMLAQSRLHHADAAGRKQCYLGTDANIAAAETKDGDTQQAASSEDVMAAADSLLGLIDGVALVRL
jgi:tripeptidyl-peptidase-2